MQTTPLVENKFRLEPIQGTHRLPQQAYTSIKEAILSLNLKPGMPLVEEELAAQLGISKTPVRDALQELERDGLVTRVPYKGTFVTEITEQDAREIFELRAVLEGLVGRLSTYSFTLREFSQAEALLDASDEALEAGDLAKASELGEQFHKLMYSHVSNKRLLTFLKMLDAQLHRLRLVSNREGKRLKKSATEHREILAALRQGNAELVETTLRDHHHSVLHDLTLSNYDTHNA